MNCIVCYQNPQCGWSSICNSCHMNTCITCKQQKFCTIEGYCALCYQDYLYRMNSKQHFCDKNSNNFNYEEEPPNKKSK